IQKAPLSLPILFFPKIDCPVRKWYFYSFLLKSLEYPLSKLVLCEILINKFPHLANQREIKGALPETGDKPYKRLRFSKKPRNFTDCIFCLLYKDTFHHFRIRRIACSHRAQHRTNHLFWQKIEYV